MAYQSKNQIEEHVVVGVADVSDKSTSKFKLVGYCTVAVALVILAGVIVNNVGPKKTVPASVPVSALPAVAPAAFAVSPEPLNRSSLVFVHNLLIEDLVLNMRNGSGVFPEFVPRHISEALASTALAKTYATDMKAAHKGYAGKVVLVHGKALSVNSSASKGVVVELPGAKGHKSLKAEFEGGIAAAKHGIKKGDDLELVCKVDSSKRGAPTLKACEPAHWVAEKAADGVVKQLEQWLVKGGKPVFGDSLATSTRLAGLYVLGTTLPQGHTCLEEIAHDNCVDTVNREKAFAVIAPETRLSAQKWFEWLQLPKPVQTPKPAV